MKSKWHFSALFLLLFTLLGAFKEHTNLPNQEIVLEFSNTASHIDNRETTIANITKKLNDLGVTNISINTSDKNILKITYYSDIQVENIKEKIAESNVNLLENNSKKQSEDSDNSEYSIAIHEIIDLIDVQNSHKEYTFEFKSNFDRSLPTNTIALKGETLPFKANYLFKTQLSVNRSISFYKETNTSGDPEVRAGPLT